MAEGSELGKPINAGRGSISGLFEMARRTLMFDQIAQEGGGDAMRTLLQKIDKDMNQSRLI